MRRTYVAVGALGSRAFSKAFFVWRWVYTGLLLLISVYILCPVCPELEPLGYIYLEFGVLPSVVGIVLAWSKVRHARWIIVAYDFLLFAGVLVLPLACADPAVILLFLPLAGFVVEGLVIALLLAQDIS